MFGDGVYDQLVQGYHDMLWENSADKTYTFDLKAIDIWWFTFYTFRFEVGVAP